MVNVLDRKLWRRASTRSRMLLAIISVIAVGVMCFVYMHRPIAT